MAGRLRPFSMGIDMTEEAELARLTRAARNRVPLDAASFLAQHPPERISLVLDRLPKVLAQRIQSHLPEDLQEQTTAILDQVIVSSIEQLMEPVQTLLAETATVEQAIDHIRTHPNPDQVTYLYVTAEDESLSGMVVIRDLLLTAPDEALSKIMLPDPFRFAADISVDDAVKAAMARQYPVYPVVDENQRMIGLIRGWRLAERQAAEISAQSGKMVGVGEGERIQSGLWTAFRLRHPWLQVNLMTAFVAGLVVSLFESTIGQIVLLAAFLPVLAGQSGNTGCQALAITLRGITLGDVEGLSLGQLLRKEVMLGAINGLLTGLVAGAVMWWMAARTGSTDAPMLALVILLAMTGACMISGLFGVLVPLALRRLGADPATASSIFLTTGTDIAGMGLMLTLATALIL